MNRDMLPVAFAVAEKPSQAKSYANAYGVTNKSGNGDFYFIPPNENFKGGLYVFWGLGHLTRLKEIHEYVGMERYKDWQLDDLPIPYPSPMVYCPATPEKENMLLNMRSIVQNLIKTHGIKNVMAISATDIDEQGSLIAQNILKFVLTPEQYQEIVMKRLWINSLEASAVRKGFKNLHSKELDQRMSLNAFTMGCSDLKIGTSLTRGYTILLRGLVELLAGKVIAERSPDGSESKIDSLVYEILGNKSFRIGRVILPTLHLIYQRTMAIENFIPEAFYELYGNFDVGTGVYEGKAKIKSNHLEEVRNLLRQHHVKEGENPSNIGKITEKTTERKHTKAPNLHSLQTLQTKANRLWKYTPKQVLEACQNLYLRKILSYPRSSMEKITTNEYRYLLANIENYKATLGATFEVAYTEPRSKQVSDSAVVEHHALIPTKTAVTQEALASLNERERNIYLEVLRTTVAMFAPDYEYDQTVITTDVNGIEFKTVGNIEVERGFKALWPEQTSKDTTDKQTDENTAQLPIINTIILSRISVEVREGRTSSPTAYTAGTILNAMATCGKELEDKEEQEALKASEGIGTVATRATAIESLQEAGYISVEKNKLILSTKGKIICKATEGTLLSNPSMTAKWEIYLQGITEGRNSSEKFLTAIDAFIDKTLQAIPLELTKSSNVAFFKELIEQHLEDSRIAVCPNCGGDIKYVSIKDKKAFYGCSNFNLQDSPCRFSIPAVIGNKKLTLPQVKSLIVKGKTNYIKFTSKEKKPYEAMLRLKDGTNEIVMEFKDKNTKTKNERR